MLAALEDISMLNKVVEDPSADCFRRSFVRTWVLIASSYKLRGNAMLGELMRNAS